MTLRMLRRVNVIVMDHVRLVRVIYLVDVNKFTNRSVHVHVQQAAFMERGIPRHSSSANWLMG